MTIHSINLLIPVKNGGETFEKCIQCWINQIIPEKWSFSITVVDDGSTDGSPQKVQTLFPNVIQVIRMPISIGRGNACNAGASQSTAEYILISDADCMPISESTISFYIESISEGIDIVFGAIIAEQAGFWGKYFDQVAQKRALEYSLGNLCALTTSNCIIKTVLFNELGGFDSQYKQYGFEDRDFIARSVSAGAKSKYAPLAIVLHCDQLQLLPICKKMYLAGLDSGPIFRNLHPDIYSKMPFSKADTQIHQYLKPFATILHPINNLLLYLGQLILKAPLPYPLKAATVKILSGAFYMMGTRKSAINSSCDATNIAKK